MKKVVVFLTIAIFVGMIAFVAYSNSDTNRRASWAYLDVNSAYGSAYNPPTFTEKGCFGSDSDGPLYSSGDSTVSYTDDGYNSTGQIGGTEAFAYPAGAEWALNEILDAGSYFENNLVLEDAEGVLSDVIGFLAGEDFKIYKAKTYNKKFAVSANAYVSCWTDNDNYETKYDLRAEVPAGFQYPNVRNPDTQTEEGSFSDYEDRSGSKNGWHHEISTDPNASASASGTNLSSGETHNTSAATPTVSTARDFDINCGFCDDSGCDVCNPHR